MNAKTKKILIFGGIAATIILWLLKDKLKSNLEKMEEENTPDTKIPDLTNNIDYNVKKINEVFASTFPPITNFFKIATTNDLDKDFVLYLQKKEGGLGRSIEDSASAFPSPYAYVDKKDGVIKTGWHTNKGITYQTFKANQNLGYKDTKENFYNMPFEIWYKIMYEKFLKRWDKYTNSNLINLYLASWAWGSGYGGAKALLKIIDLNTEKLNNLIKTKGEKYTLAYLVNQRVNFYRRLAEQKPKNKKWLQGWINGAVSFYVLFYKYAKN